MRLIHPISENGWDSSGFDPINFHLFLRMVLPGHMHLIMRLPWGDANYSKR